MKYLNVAEKNKAAKTIATILSDGSQKWREGYSKYNKIYYDFKAMVGNEEADMVMTSVSGHILNIKFSWRYQSFYSCDPIKLFDDIQSEEEFEDKDEKIKRTLEGEIDDCDGLIIWTDCDREGENIGYEIINVCNAVKPNLKVYRAKFSEITPEAVAHALANLEQPNKNVSDAVDVRRQLDLITGAAFSRLLTLQLKWKVSPSFNEIVSYGSCQFPTLGFVVERYKTIEDFVPGSFWKLQMKEVNEGVETTFSWKRDKMNDKIPCEAILAKCRENPIATVESDPIRRTYTAPRPLPLDTVELLKNISTVLGITVKEAMDATQFLYTEGLTSYPRTDTNIFPENFDLETLVEQQNVDHRWGDFAQRILTNGGPDPRQGDSTDNAHPPIYPAKCIPDTTRLNHKQLQIYEYIVRRFLACVSKDVVIQETVVTVDIAGEKFEAKGLKILEKNYLDVYKYEDWNEQEIRQYHAGETFTPKLEIIEERTSPPNLLTEAELVNLMAEHGIGTDSTYHMHIEKIKERTEKRKPYVTIEGGRLKPTPLGVGLVEGYENIEVPLAQPMLQAEFEEKLKLICGGALVAEDVKRDQIQKYKDIYKIVEKRMREFVDSVGNRIGLTSAL